MKHFLLFICLALVTMANEKKEIEFTVKNKESNQKFIVINVKEKEKNKNIKYLIKKGDTLSEISLKYKIPIKRIIDSNQIENPNLIYENKYLILTYK